MLKRNKKQRKPKSSFREWVDAIVFAVVVATAVRWLVVEPYQIPTSSMEKSLLVGDFLFVSKFHYGPRNAKTLMQVPLTHQKIWGTEVPSYLDWIQVPFFRLPGFTEVRKGDAVVFNTPEELDVPVDMRTYLIKRCVATAGDTISIIDGVVHINKDAQETPEGLQHSYYIRSDQMLRDRFFDKYQISEYNKVPGGYRVMTNETKAAAIRAVDFIDEVVAITDENNVALFNYNVFSGNSNVNWTFNNFGPLYIPSKNATIELNKKHVALYGELIMNHEGLENVSISNGQLFIDGQAMSSYTFRQDYFFMMGDNRHNSHDSRAWGFVPMDHIVGKALFTWFSLEEGPTVNFFGRVRWDRILKKIK